MEKSRHKLSKKVSLSQDSLGESIRKNRRTRLSILASSLHLSRLKYKLQSLRTSSTHLPLWHRARTYRRQAKTCCWRIWYLRKKLMEIILDLLQKKMRTETLPKTRLRCNRQSNTDLSDEWSIPMMNSSKSRKESYKLAKRLRKSTPRYQQLRSLLRRPNLSSTSSRKETIIGSSKRSWVWGSMQTKTK